LYEVVGRRSIENPRLSVRANRFLFLFRFSYSRFQILNPIWPFLFTIADSSGQFVFGFLGAFSRCLLSLGPEIQNRRIVFGHYVEAACNDGPAVFNSGFVAGATSRIPPQPLPPAAFAWIDRGPATGDVVVKVKGIASPQL